jgi:hypothetical protein|tara:strand:- start:383 stop:580 length:198 start_codon:yes stop_codon:yes gene_type:complete
MFTNIKKSYKLKVQLNYNLNLIKGLTVKKENGVISKGELINLDILKEVVQNQNKRLRIIEQTINN